MYLEAYFMARPSDEARKLEINIAENQLELSTIKSIQLEFVRHSLLSRKIIKVINE